MRKKIAYLLQRFPHYSETFILREMDWLLTSGMDIQVYSLLSPQPGPVHAQAGIFLSRTHYSPFLSRAVLQAQWRFLRHHPRRYARALGTTIRLTVHEPRVLIRALALFPKSVFFAADMQARGIDHAHAHFAYLGGIMAAAIAQLLDISYTIHPHAFDLFMRDARDVRAELEGAYKVIAISEYNREYLTRLFPSRDPADFPLIHCGVDTEDYRPIHPIRRSTKPLSILAVGRLVKKKGFEYLIDACSVLAERGFQFECRIVGDGPLGEALRTKAARHRLEGVVIFEGARNQEYILALLQDSDLFALPCVATADGDQDGVPVSLTEAMACAIPVVTTPVGGIPELVRSGWNGYLVPERDGAALADALQRLISDPALRKRMGARARETVRTSFQIGVTARQLADIFREVTSSPAGRKHLEPEVLR